MKKKFNVDGMMCASCQATVERTVNKLEGVNFVNVSLLSKSMIVDFEESKIDSKRICAAVNSAGYSAELYVNQSIKEIEAKKKKDIKERLTRLIASIVLLVLLMSVSMGGMWLHDAKIFPTEAQMGTNMGALIMLVEVAAQILLVIPIIAINFHFFTSGYKALFKAHPNMESLVALGSTVALGYGLYIFGVMIVSYAGGDYHSVMQNSMNVYIEGSGSVIVFVSLGKFLENRATSKAISSIANLVSLVPDTASLRKEDGTFIDVSTDELQIGDVIEVKPGEAIPSDGFILEGYLNVDESLITGESLPVYKTSEAKVIGGSINKDGYALVKVAAVGKDSTISKIIDLVQEASDSKAPLARLADRISLFFVPTVISISVIVFLCWALFGFGDSLGVGFYASRMPNAFRMGISVLVVSCPCALGLATPLAIMAGTGKGAENGILIKSAQAFETLNKVDTVVFDKTGTLTKAEMKVQQYKIYSGKEKSAIALASSLESCSEHPLAKAIISKANEMGVKVSKIKDFVYDPGLGVKGKDSAIGNREYMESLGVDVSFANNDYLSFSFIGMTVLYLAKGGNLIAMFAVGDTEKETSKDAISDLFAQNKRVVLLTGDNKEAASHVGESLGIKEIISQVKPSEKKDVIESLQKEGHKVAYVGDGVNDAPSLIQADVGIAIGAGSDVAIDSADIVLVHSDPTDVATAMRLSKKVSKNIKENLIWAFFYNLILIPIAAGALFPLKEIALTPTFASIAMSLSSITVVLNALRLRLFHKKLK
ncbi:MAG: heavy metal translocating P-type ATPase [Bacilli bacterium]|nr:heavy metal translocating P-type ATPase [Bacilli bacterium]